MFLNPRKIKRPMLNNIGRFDNLSKKRSQLIICTSMHINCLQFISVCNDLLGIQSNH